MLSYTVKHAFNHGDTWYTRENAEQIKDIPRHDRDELMRVGMIEEHDERGPAAPTPPAAANASKGK
jgi:hypothetical protein